MNSDITAKSPSTGLPHELDPVICRRARLSRDTRFDGEFYLAVRTTGIYCRPICPAPPPAEKNVLYFHSAVQAAQAGFRPCLRCRPESAPNSPAWRGTSTTVERAVQLLGQGALNDGSLAGLAQRLGVGDRYLRKLFQRELGVSPQALALNQRLLFAKKLLAETALSITEVAFAAGFGSVRRFNSAVQQQFRLTPGALRGRNTVASARLGIQLQLHYRPPYDWDGVADFFMRHAIAGVESATPLSYRRNILLGGVTGSFEVHPASRKNALLLTIQLSDYSVLMPAVARVRRMFDLDANPAAIRQVLSHDARLRTLLTQFPGIRSPGHWSVYEATLRAIVGQQISTQAARGVLARLADTTSEAGEHLQFPYAAGIAELRDEHFAMPGKRREAVRALCRHCSAVGDEPELAAIAAFPGVGPWTVSMVAMRGCGLPDAFPNRDLGLEKAWARLPPGKTLALQTQTTHWRPWRSYAANLLWRSLSL